MKDERQFANSKGGETRLSRACAVGSDRKSLTVEFVLPPSLAAGLAVRYQPRVVRSPAAHAPGVRSGRSCHTQPTRPWKSPVRPAVGSGRSSHTRLRQPAGAVCLRPRAQPALRRRLAYWKRYRGRVVSVRHARPAAHTLRVVVRTAALSGLSAYVQSISQRGRQRHPAVVTPTVTASHQRPHPRRRNRHAAAPQESATGP